MGQPQSDIACCEYPLLCCVTIIIATMSHRESIPVRRKIDPLAVVKDYATVPRLEYR